MKLIKLLERLEDNEVVEVFSKNMDSKIIFETQGEVGEVLDWLKNNSNKMKELGKSKVVNISSWVNIVNEATIIITIVNKQAE